MELELEFERFEDGALVKCIVEYNFVADCDWVDHGEHGSWRDTSFIDIVSIEYSVNDKKYVPTKEEKKFWECDLSKDCSRHYGEAA